jgi:hypothetical protein
LILPTSATVMSGIPWFVPFVRPVFALREVAAPEAHRSPAGQRR